MADLADLYGANLPAYTAGSRQGSIVGPSPHDIAFKLMPNVAGPAPSDIRVVPTPDDVRRAYTAQALARARQQHRSKYAVEVGQPVIGQQPLFAVAVGDPVVGSGGGGR